MPDHVHMILGTEGKMKLQDIIRDLRSYTARKIRLYLEDRVAIDPFTNDELHYFYGAGLNNPNNKDFQLWQHGYHGVELSSNQMMDQRLEYTHMNPVKAGLVDDPEEWRWSSAVDYYGGQGLVDILYIN
jgi:REP element-mobilizing transposase RayT